MAAPLRATRTATGVSLQDGSLSLSGITAQLRFLQGEVLTVIDAAYVNEAQNKATKDLIKQAFAEKLRWVTSLAQGYTNGGTLEQFPGLQKEIL